jgi:hypothetical protein
MSRHNFKAYLTLASTPLLGEIIFAAKLKIPRGLDYDINHN